MARATKRQQSEKVIMALVRFPRPMANGNGKAQDEITAPAPQPARTVIVDCDRAEQGGLQPAYATYLETKKDPKVAFTAPASRPARTVKNDCEPIEQGSLQPAYHTYLEARKDLDESFKQRERRQQEAYRESEQRYQLSKEAIAMAIKVREKTEQDALIAYREELDKAVNKASHVHKEAIEIAIKVREKAEQDALVAYREELDKAVNKASQVYKEAVEMAIKVREKAEQDALVASTEEVDEAVDKASQVYKDKMKQAWIDCKQRVMDAWKDSIETSVQMAGVFEQDRNKNTNPGQPLILNEALVNQSG